MEDRSIDRAEPLSFSEQHGLNEYADPQTNDYGDRIVGPFVCAVNTCDNPATLGLIMPADDCAVGCTRHTVYACSDHRRAYRTARRSFRVSSTYVPQHWCQHCKNTNAFYSDGECMECGRIDARYAPAPITQPTVIGTDGYASHVERGHME